jgi:hypothetical protein
VHVINFNVRCTVDTDRRRHKLIVQRCLVQLLRVPHAVQWNRWKSGCPLSMNQADLSADFDMSRVLPEFKDTLESLQTAVHLSIILTSVER